MRDISKLSIKEAGNEVDYTDIEEWSKSEGELEKFNYFKKKARKVTA